jgi:two-component sensor histidine kinase
VGAALAELIQRVGGSAGVQKIRWRLSPAATVVSLAWTLTFVIFAVFAVLCVQGYGTTIEQAKTKAQSAAAIVADEASWMVGSARALLAEIADVSQNPADITDDSKAAFDAALKALPTAASLGFYDATGNAWGNAGTALLPENISDASFFKALEAGGEWTISPQLKDATSGKPIFVVAQRLGTVDFGGVVLLAFGGDVLDAFWAAQKLGAESTVSLIRADGWLISRYPALPETMNLSAAIPFTTQADQDTGAYLSPKSPVDGISRVVAFRRVAALGLIAIASISQDVALAPLWNAIITVLWLLIPIGLALIVGSLITARILRRSARTQASLAAALENNDVLFREIHHRVKNNLQSVASLLQMQPIPREIKINMGQRIAAMSAVHEHIYRSNNFATVQVKEYLSTLIGDIRAGADSRIEMIEQVEDLAVDKDAATPLGLILNEVVVNAFKHGFPDGREGVITVRLWKRGDGQAELTVEDNGVGFDPSADGRGIGRRLIAALTSQLGGVSEFESGTGGSRFALVFPLAKAA